jgi:hypothetical protein
MADSNRAASGGKDMMAGRRIKIKKDIFRSGTRQTKVETRGKIDLKWQLGS